MPLHQRLHDRSVAAKNRGLVDQRRGRWGSCLRTGTAACGTGGHCRPIKWRNTYATSRDTVSSNKACNAQTSEQSSQTNHREHAGHCYPKSSDRNAVEPLPHQSNSTRPLVGPNRLRRYKFTFVVSTNSINHVVAQPEANAANGMDEPQVRCPVLQFAPKV